MHGLDFLEIIEDIDQIELGEYKEQMIEEAYNYASGTICDKEEQVATIATLMNDYLEGASKMYQIIKKKEGILEKD